MTISSIASNSNPYQYWASSDTKQTSAPVKTTTTGKTTTNPQAAESKEIDKAELERQELIRKLAPKYNIVKSQEKLANGKVVEVYRVTAKVDVNLSTLKEDLKLKPGVVSACNAGYGQYDGPGGTYIDNKPMKGVTIKFPVDKLGEKKDGWEAFCDFFGF